MTEIKLTPRLECIASLVPQGAKFADIGTDHAYLPLYLLLRGQIVTAIASDLREAPLDSARRNAALYGAAEKLELRCGEGLSTISADECNVISIAGMGGETIAEILRDAPWTAAGQHLLLLQPMTMIPKLRQFLYMQGYAIEQECVCTEGRRQYIVLRARAGAPIRAHCPPIADCYESPALRRDPGAGDYLHRLYHHQARALAGMLQAGTADETALAVQKHILENISNALEGLK